ncbi:MAG TPA: hypothetical protein VKE93_12380 [Candidatus Angelobacter sp.]|nr:hypothetical protein [Candidatus Angelobacter sp.]
MKTKLTIVVMSIVLLNCALCHAEPGTVAGLQPGLRDALLRDAACSPADHPSPPRPGGLETPGVEPAPAEAGPSPMLDAAVTTQDIHSAAGANVGVIVTFNDACHCRDSACGTYVYLKNNAGFKLALSGAFSSMHAVRVFKRGYPSLTGKVQISKAQVESTVYDWNGKTYAPSLCATITQTAGRKVPSILHHDCAKAP